MFRSFPPTPPAGPIRRVRTLSLEYLESRVVLSGLPEVAVIPPSLPTTIPTDNEVSSASPSTVAEVPSSAIPVLTSTVVDAATNGLVGQPASAGHVPDGTLPQTLNPPVSCEASNLPPCIVEFTAALEYGYWRLRGYVLDDSSTAGLTVHFAGILSAQTTTDENGRFELVVADSSVGAGWVFAHVVDSNGQSSDYEQVTLYA